MNKNSTSKISEDEYPEVTQADFDRAVLRKGLEPVEKKQRITILLDAAVISYFRRIAGKRGYQTLINESLKKFIASDTAGQVTLEKMLRKIIKEELKYLDHAH